MKWMPRTLDELGYVSRGRSRHRPRDAAHLYGGPYPFIQTGDIKHANLYVTDYSQTYTEAGLAQSRIWKAGALCITIAANIADTAILGIDACFPDSVIGFIPDDEKADVRFIKYLFDAIVQKRLKQFTQGAAQDNLSQSKLLSLKLFVPEVTEQRRIASILSAYDDLIENNRRRIQLLEQAARLLYKEWFVHLRFPGHEDVKIKDGVPEGWTSGVIGDLGEIVTGKTPSKKMESYYGDDVPFIKTPDMHGNSVVTKTEENLSDEGASSQATKMLPPRSILVSCIGTVGVVALNASVAQTNQQINAIIPRTDLLRYWSFFMVETLRPLLEGVGGGATMPNINKSKFSAIPVVIPSRQILDQFSSVVAPNIDQIEQLTVMNDRLARARDLLLPRLMNGEVAVWQKSSHAYCSQRRLHLCLNYGSGSA